jgi:aarF domain-containing kinase
MRMNLPLELDFVHEAENAAHVRENFSDVLRTSLYIPEVIRATKRTLVMEYISGARVTWAHHQLLTSTHFALQVDDLGYLAAHGIDRNQVSQELSRIFSRMVYIHGFFHAGAVIL